MHKKPCSLLPVPAASLLLYPSCHAWPLAHPYAKVMALLSGETLIRDVCEHGLAGALYTLDGLVEVCSHPSWAMLRARDELVRSLHQGAGKPSIPVDASAAGSPGREMSRTAASQELVPMVPAPALSQELVWSLGAPYQHILRPGWCRQTGNYSCAQPSCFALPAV